MPFGYSSRIRRLLLPSLSLGLAACQSPYSTDSAYNVLGRTQALTSQTPAYVVALEKRPKADAGWDETIRKKNLLRPGPETHPLSSADDLRLQHRLIKRTLNDSKVHVVTHVVKTEAGRISEYLYNTYDPAIEDRSSDEKSIVPAVKPGERQTLVAGLAALKTLEDRIRADIATGAYSHVLVMCMGWANDQQESLLRVRMLTDNLAKAAAQDGKPAGFRPLLVAITWPSQWWGLSDYAFKRTLGHIGSYANKSNDADEIGLFLANRLVNVHLSGAVPETVPLVLIGHSMGARVLSRAYYSDLLLPDAKPNGRRPDLLISLQPAYSARRWISRGGRFEVGSSGEGAPYLVPGTRPHFITTSRFDDANPVAFWSRHIGGRGGMKCARSHPDLFVIATWRPDKKEKETEPQNWSLCDCPDGFSKPVVIDADSIVRPGSLDSLGLAHRSGHNDILDQEMGELLYDLIGRVKPNSRNN